MESPVHGHGLEHGHGGAENKRIALLIAVLALVLAFSETLGKAAQTTALSQNIEASNLWSFFQAKTIRMTVLRTAAEGAEVELNQIAEPKTKEAIAQRVAAWRKTAERYDSEPETGEGRKELTARAKEAEKKRERSLAAYHHYEVASAGVQIAIVLASAAIITGMTALVWVAVGLGIVGVVFCGIGFFAPMAVHLF
ncbi:MAG TPA: DUF4337 domain-containing protein [Burkholderiales bacterium]|nr:DUF4337 domain-containing protein [Burkholderiales bacterium]